MLLGVIIEISVALVAFWIAWSISKGNIKLIHDYHTGNIKADDKSAYCKSMSKGVMAIGIGALISSLCSFKENVLGVLMSIFGGIIIGIIIMNAAQRKYNGGWFS